MKDILHDEPQTTPRWDLWGVGTGLILLSLIARIASYPIATSDYTGFLNNWFNTLATHPGLSAFQSVFSDYTPLYLYFLKFLTLIPVSSLYSIKTLSLVFDVVIAVCVVLILRVVSKDTLSMDRLYLAGAIMFSIPTLLINSSLWGQSDAVYTLGCVASLLFLLKDRLLFAVLAFGFAVSVKLQAIFFLPVLIGYCIRKPYGLLYLLVVPAFFFLSLVPAWLAGASFQTLALTFVHQSSEYTDLNVSSPSVFAFVQQHALAISEQNTLFFLGLGMAVVCAFGIIVGMFKRADLSSGRMMIFLATLSVLALPFFLPRMHERYFYLADVFASLYALSYPRVWYVPALIVTASLLSYMPYLSGQVALFSSLYIDLRVPAALLALALVILSYRFFLVFRQRSETYSSV